MVLTVVYTRERWKPLVNKMKKSIETELSSSTTKRQLENVAK